MSAARRAVQHLRGMVVAVFLLWINVIGLGLGPLSVGLLNDRLFGSPLAIGQSMAADIVGPVLFLLGPASRYLTGEVIHVSGGAVMA